MVEMTETANILNNATASSLVLMDEVGRGTSTYDGLSLAWACAEHLARHVAAFTLFATHYFEITALPEVIPEMANVHLAATEHHDDIVFLHNIRQGPASKSYGLQVAKLAGIPATVLESAKRQLANLELSANTSSAELAESDIATATATAISEQPKPSENQNIPHQRGGPATAVLQADLFAQAPPSPVEERLKGLSLDNLTPLCALQTLYDLKELLKK